MLVLSRRITEKIVIGNNVVVEILSVNEGVVRLGIKAPQETSIHRFEVFNEIETANRAAQVAIGELDQATLENLAVHLFHNQKSV